MQVEEGKIVTGKVSGITNFGVFVNIDEETTGLVHISEVSSTYVNNIHDHVKSGDIVKVKVLAPDKKGKLALSIKQASNNRDSSANSESNRNKPNKRQALKLPETDLHAKPEEFDWFAPKDTDLSFEDKLNKFKQASDEKMHDIKHNLEAKRGGRGKVNSY